MQIKSVVLVSVLTILTMAFAACIQPLTPPADGGQEGSAATEAESAAESAGGEETTLYVGPTQVDCVGVGPMTCMLVKTEPDGEYTFFYNQIEGFDYVPGYEYELLVNVEEVANPPADSSSLKYTLIEVVSATEVGPTLEGTPWQMVALADQDGTPIEILPDVEVTALFEDGRVSGSDGCNNYSGTYTVDGTSLTVGPELMGTMMACPGPIMDQAAAYTGALTSAASYAIVNNQLRILNESGRVVVTYDQRIPVSLTGTTWNAIGYNNGKQAVVSIAIDTEITAVFGEDGTLSGSAGCNNYNAGYEVDGENIKIGPAAVTMMMCPEPEGIMEQEALYLAALEMANVYSIDGDRLQLRTSEGSLVADYTAEGLDDGAVVDAADSEEPAAATPEAEPVEREGIVGVEWHFFEFESGDGSQIFVDNPDRYTLLLSPDGSANVVADCNNGSGSYQLDGSSLTVDIVAVTRAICSPNSFSDDYLRLLGDVVTYVEKDGILALNLKMDAGNMLFQLADATADQVHRPTDLIAQDAISIDPGELATSYHWQVLLPTPYDASMPPAPVGAPAHAVITFDYLPARRALAEGGPYIVIYPVEDSVNLWQDAGDDTIAKSVAALQALLEEQPATPAPPMPILPPPGAMNDLAVQTQYIDFGGGNGVRFVGRLSQDASPVLNGQTDYYAQGLTEDGRFYVSMRWPVTTSVLPGSMEEMTPEQQQAIENDFATYMKQTTDMLNGLEPSDWAPNLADLDAVLKSLSIAMPESQ